MTHEDVRKVACYVPITAQMAEDAAAARSVVDELFDRWQRPWRYPDRAPLPVFDLFPLLTRMAAWAKSLRTREDEDAA